jgi:CubicO group peptidase (beta-lactamase class C family)
MRVTSATDCIREKSNPMACSPAFCGELSGFGEADNASARLAPAKAKPNMMEQSRLRGGDMRTFAPLLVAAVAALLSVALPAQADAVIDRTKLEAFVDGAATDAMNSQHIAGLTVGVVDRGGVLLAKGYGTAGAGKAVDPNTMFRVGSISKTVVWIAITQLIEQKKLTLDDPINAHLPPALRIPDEGFTKPIRVRDLMTHTEGFEDSVLGTLFTHDPAALVPFDDYLAHFRVHRVRAPGVISVYSNYGASLAAAIVEHETGMRWEDYAEQRILRPLGMVHATYREPYPAAMASKGFAAPLSAADKAHVSTGFSYVAGAYQPQQWEYVTTPAIGALSASATDMAAYMRALLDPQRMQSAGVLSAASALSLREPLRRDFPGFGAWLHGFIEVPAPNGEIGFGHDGALMYQQALMIVFPKSGVGIFVAVNTPSGAAFNGRLARAIMAKFTGTKPPPPRVALSAAEAAQYAGNYKPLRRSYYRSERGLYGALTFTVTALRDGSLLLSNSDHRYYYAGHNVFQTDDGQGRIGFAMQDGRMLLHPPVAGGPSERVSVFATSNWLFLILGIVLLASIVRVGRGAWRIVRGRETTALLMLDGAAVLWLVGGAALVLAVVPWLSDQAAAVYGFPGPLLPFACWMFVAATVASVLALTAAIFLRPSDWRWTRWSSVTLTLAVFAVCAVTLQRFGLLGYSGW